MNLKHLEYFIVLAKEKNFSRASEILGITQPTLTQSVQKLESVLGTSLFDRSFSTLTLTDGGKVLLESCKKIVDIWNQTGVRITEINNGISGCVKVGMAPFRSNCIAPALVKTFHEKFPEAKLSIHELRTDILFEYLDSGEIDIAISAGDKKTVSSYEAVPVFKEEVLIAVHEGMLENNPALSAIPENGTVDFSVFSGADFIILGDDQMLHKHYKTLCSKTGVKAKELTVCTNIETSLTLANSGFGAALVLSTGIEYYKEHFPHLRYFSLTPSIPVRTVYALYRKNQYLSTPAKYIVKFLEDGGLY